MSLSVCWDIVLGWGTESYLAIGKEREELVKVDWPTFKTGSVVEVNNSKIKVEGIDRNKATIYLRHL